MKAAFSERFTRQYKTLSPERKAKVDKQLSLLLSNLRHPSERPPLPNPLLQRARHNLPAFHSTGVCLFAPAHFVASPAFALVLV